MYLSKQCSHSDKHKLVPLSAGKYISPIRVSKPVTEHKKKRSSFIQLLLQTKVFRDYCRFKKIR